ncbi:MAG TPA: biotin-dependent carboxyltransferase family protein [Polyangiaceae bacterium]|nr:biotin-dependent carboxyltransferase family protein [Polyangiaceae bacterium]
MPLETSAREIRIIAAPPGATVQDAGRSGWLHAGVPPSGPLDATAHAAANLAVGNDPREAALEIPLGQLRIAALGRARVAIDGETAVVLAAGEELLVPACSRAVRYLAVAGGFAVAPVLGSRSTLLVAGWGGFWGRGVRPGDALPIGPEGEGSQGASAAPSISDAPDPAVLRVQPGPHVGKMPAEALAQLVAATWHVSSRSDRVGVRLEGPPIVRRGDDRGPPAPMVRGAIQITTDGTPIVLGPDHPVTGGYPVLAVISRSSQAMLARLRPRRALRFVIEAG